mmetsp:Transcript_162900/g.522344  ORF Transcript_162900/g.522344 Transcript_162900/m.522344 type:complete len:256 (+) Transcript_162900:1420-2187(+)
MRRGLLAHGAEASRRCRPHSGVRVRKQVRRGARDGVARAEALGHAPQSFDGGRDDCRGRILQKLQGLRLVLGPLLAHGPDGGHGSGADLRVLVVKAVCNLRGRLGARGAQRAQRGAGRAGGFPEDRGGLRRDARRGVEARRGVLAPLGEQGLDGRHLRGSIGADARQGAGRRRRDAAVGAPQELGELRHLRRAPGAHRDEEVHSRLSDAPVRVAHQGGDRRQLSDGLAHVLERVKRLRLHLGVGIRQLLQHFGCI